MANYTQITETFWIVKPCNIREWIQLIYLQIRGKTGKITIQENGKTRRVWAMFPKNVEEFKKTLRPS